MDKLEKYDMEYYRKFTFKSEVEKALHTLEGIMKGISIDKTVNQKEIDELINWCTIHEKLIYRHPFNELIPLIINSLNDNYLDEEEIKDILWVCDNFRVGNEYYNMITSDIQKLEGILHGILSDNRITKEEIEGLKKWLEINDHLAQTFPYDEIYSLVVSVLSDKVISKEEEKILKVFFSEFVDINKSLSIDKNQIDILKKEITIKGICALCPDIEIKNKYFCFTGKSSKTTRKGISNAIEALGGFYHDRVTQETDYLVIGNEGNPCWAFSCYGRKVEAAVKLRKSGHNILIIHENDFWDHWEDYVNSQCL